MAVQKKEAEVENAEEQKAETAQKRNGAYFEQKAETAQKRNGAYFVSPHPDGGWQVKKANAQKALKKFKTKAEAEAYAKQVASNQGTTVVRQKKDGKIQKKR